MPNGNQRGSSYSRRIRKAWLLSPASGHGGDGEKAPCWECGDPVTYETMVVDRIEEGGSYARRNIRIHCHLCSNRQGARIANEIKRAKWEAAQWVATKVLR